MPANPQVTDEIVNVAHAEYHKVLGDKNRSDPMRAALESALADHVVGWRTMDSAPKDGSKFLAFTADFEFGHRFNERVQEARWSGKTPSDPIGNFASINGQIVTHWMPLPAAPLPQKEG